MGGGGLEGGGGKRDRRKQGEVVRQREVLTL